MDQDFDGYITAEDFSRAFGGSTGSEKIEFNLLKVLLKLKSKKRQSKVNYTEFSEWLGAIIEPTEGFFFRHDSQKNP